MSRYYDDYLMHSGRKGMHWYERLYQNKDGSLTPLGRIHYGVGPARKKSNKKSDLTKIAQTYIQERAETKRQKMQIAAERQKRRDEMQAKVTVAKRRAIAKADKERAAAQAEKEAKYKAAFEAKQQKLAEEKAQKEAAKQAKRELDIRERATSSNEGAKTKWSMNPEQFMEHISAYSVDEIAEQGERYKVEAKMFSASADRIDAQKAAEMALTNAKNAEARAKMEMTKAKLATAQSWISTAKQTADMLNSFKTLLNIGKGNNNNGEKGDKGGKGKWTISDKIDMKGITAPDKNIVDRLKQKWKNDRSNMSKQELKQLLKKATDDNWNNWDFGEIEKAILA